MKKRVARPVPPHLVSSLFGDCDTDVWEDECRGNDPVSSASVPYSCNQTASELGSTSTLGSIASETVNWAVELSESSQMATGDVVESEKASDTDRPMDVDPPTVASAVPARMQPSTSRSVNGGKCRSYMLGSSIFDDYNAATEPQMKTGKKCNYGQLDEFPKSRAAGRTIEQIKYRKRILDTSEEPPYRLIRKPCSHREDTMYGVFHQADFEPSSSASTTDSQRMGMRGVMNHDSSTTGLLQLKPARRQLQSTQDSKLNVLGGSFVTDDETDIESRSSTSCDGDVLSSTVWDSASYMKLFGSAIAPPPPKSRRQDTQNNVFGGADVTRPALSEAAFDSGRKRSAKLDLLDWDASTEEHVLVKSRRTVSVIKQSPPGHHAAGVRSNYFIRENTFDNLFGGKDSREAPSSRPQSALDLSTDHVRYTSTNPKITKDSVSCHLNTAVAYHKGVKLVRRNLKMWDEVNTITGENLPYRESEDGQKIKNAWIQGRLTVT